MNRTRRLLFSVLVVALLLGTLAMPLAAQAGKYGRQMAVTWVLPGQQQTLSVGDVTLVIPAGALPLGGPVVAVVKTNPKEIRAEFTPDYTFRKPVLLSFGKVNPVYYVQSKNGKDVTPLEGYKGSDGKYYFPITHFSRYSGWF